MKKNGNKDIITDRSENIGMKSSVNRNLPIDISRNSLLSSEIGKKLVDKNNNEIKQINLTTERSINKKIRKELENDSMHSLDNFDLEYSPKKKI